MMHDLSIKVLKIFLYVDNIHIYNLNKEFQYKINSNLYNLVY